jgi:hypothetical protein
MKRRSRRKYWERTREVGGRTRVSLRESHDPFAGIPRHELFAGHDPETEERKQRRVLLAKALAGNGTALTELRALRVTRWERGGKVVIQNGQNGALALDRK